MVSQRLRPLMTAPTRDPGSRRLATAKASLAITSSGRAGSIQRPRRRDRSLSGGRPRAGMEIRRPVAGSSSPGTSSVTSATTRVAASATPGMAASRSSRRRGARFKEANTSAKRWRS